MLSGALIKILVILTENQTLPCDSIQSSFPIAFYNQTVSAFVVLVNQVCSETENWEWCTVYFGYKTLLYRHNVSLFSLLKGFFGEVFLRTEDVVCCIDCKAPRGTLLCVILSYINKIDLT